MSFDFKLKTKGSAHVKKDGRVTVAVPKAISKELLKLPKTEKNEKIREFLEKLVQENKDDT